MAEMGYPLLIGDTEDDGDDHLQGDRLHLRLSRYPPTVRRPRGQDRGGGAAGLDLDDRGFERINADIAGRPQLIRGNTQLLFDGMRVSENWCSS